ncbi:MAG: PepSY domain-containing protein [Gammaproteobacteria bacterium]|nr:MAG: PepSY domain-containing protein [Gammaproteobacteria bacterium]
MRLLGLFHRWFGLFIAVFLFIAGLTGAIIAWDHELDSVLNPGFYHAQNNESQESASAMQSPLELAAQFERENPDLFVTFMPLELEKDGALSAMIAPRPTADGKTPKLDFNQVGINPYTAEVQAKREWGAISLARENILPFIYKLHYSLHLPDLGSLQTGILFMGIVGIVWLLDCFIALSISFPSRAQWRKSFAFRWGASRQKVTFDLHRSGGVWIWVLLLIIAVTSVSMNLSSQVVRPVVSLFSTLTPSPFEQRTFGTPVEPKIGREAMVSRAQTQANIQGIEAPLGGIFYSAETGLYGVGFYAPGKDHGDWGLGNPWLYFDGKTGDYVGGTIPGTGSAGDIFMQLQFPLHSGRIAGTAGRVVVTVLGLAIAMLSVTGIIIWARKRRSRLLTRAVKSTAATLPLGNRNIGLTD